MGSFRFNMILSDAQGEAVREAAQQAGHRFVSEFVRQVLSQSVKQSGLPWPDDLPPTGMGRKKARKRPQKTGDKNA